MTYLNDIKQCTVEERKRVLVVIFGEEAVDAYSDLGEGDKIDKDSLSELGTVNIILFDTIAERDAYLRGVEDSSGWFEYAVAEPSELE